MIFRAMEATAAVDVRRVIRVRDAVLDLLAGGIAGVRGVAGVVCGSQGWDNWAAPGSHTSAPVSRSCQLCWGGFQQIQRLVNRPDVSWVRSKGSRLTFRSRKEKT